MSLTCLSAAVVWLLPSPPRSPGTCTGTSTSSSRTLSVRGVPAARPELRGKGWQQQQRSKAWHCHRCLALQAQPWQQQQQRRLSPLI